VISERTCLPRNVAACVLVLATMMVTASPVGAGEQSMRSLLPDDIQWSQRRTSPDVFIASIYGDTKKAQPYAFRVRAQAGHSLAPHTHIDERTVTILSGVYWTGVGETFDESKLKAYPAGSFYVIPAGVPHFSAVLEGEVEFQEGGFGPSSHKLVESGN